METLDQTTEQLLLEEQNTRTFLRGAIDRLKSQSKIIPLTTTTSDDLLQAIESTARQQGITLTYGKTQIVGKQADGTTLNTIELIERALLGTGHNLADKRSTRHIESGSFTDLYRDEMSPLQKSVYLRDHSIEQFMALPSKRTVGFVADSNLMTKAQYLSLPWKKRAALGLGEKEISAILKRN
jgi:hypothetical protein